MSSSTDNGYIYVASHRKEYYYAAKESAQSLLDFYPEAKITLFTQEEWVEDEDDEIFDNVITGIPTNVRAKLWALSQTPYDLTLYLDCDTHIQHEDISNVFDFIGDNDIIFTRNRPYNAKITKLNDQDEMVYHCGIFLYRKKEMVCMLFDQWYENYLKQIEPDWDPSPYPEAVKPWDTFTMWYLLNKTVYGRSVKIGDFPSPDARWNFVYGHYEEELQGTEIVILHYLLKQSKLKGPH
tara:strand:+ start:571 stop:1284 length:714 start_codon:yes stop_codon:yes gene_type:complete